MAIARNYEEMLSEDLADPVEAAAYLTACLEEGDDVFLLGVRDVAKVHGGMAELANDAELGRQALYRMLSANGNPTLASISAILDALGMRLQCVPAESH